MTSSLKTSNRKLKVVHFQLKQGMRVNKINHQKMASLHIRKSSTYFQWHLSTSICPAHSVLASLALWFHFLRSSCTWLLKVSYLSTKAYPPHRGLPKLLYLFCSQVHPARRVLYHIFLTFPLPLEILSIFDNMFLILLFSTLKQT